MAVGAPRSDYQKQKAVQEPPAALALFGYALSPLSILSGPFVEFVDYCAWANGKFLWSVSVTSELPTAALPALRAFGEATCCLVIYLGMAADLKTFADPSWATAGLPYTGRAWGS